MASKASTDEQMRNEIARLTASINQHKNQPPASRYPYTGNRQNTYVNPSYNIRQPARLYDKSRAATTVGPPVLASTSQVKEVVLGGVAFQSSARSLVRKDLPKSSSTSTQQTRPNSSGPTTATSITKKIGHRPPTSYIYKHRPKPNRGRGRAQRGGYARGGAVKRMRYINKPCPRFSSTGVCNRALTCQYQHNPDKIAICWNFLQGDCPNSAETCNLSHDPTPQRTPLCLHFLNNGRCNRTNCPFPHANLGARKGICRDFAVLGYCESGLDCDKQHVRECPDFAETGTCSLKGCKLPHVIRANKNRKPAPSISRPMGAADGGSEHTESHNDPAHRSVQDAQLGDEFISLTFNESDDEESETGDDDEDENDDDEEGEDEEMDENPESDEEEDHAMT